MYELCVVNLSAGACDGFFPLFFLSDFSLSHSLLFSLPSPHLLPETPPKNPVTYQEGIESYTYSFGSDFFLGSSGGGEEEEGGQEVEREGGEEGGGGVGKVEGMGDLVKRSLTSMGGLKGEEEGEGTGGQMIEMDFIIGKEGGWEGEEEGEEGEELQVEGEEEGEGEEEEGVGEEEVKEEQGKKEQVEREEEVEEEQVKEEEVEEKGGKEEATEEKVEGGSKE